MANDARPTDVPGVVDATDDSAPFLLPTGTVTFLLTDVEQSTIGWETAPDAMAKAISRHYEILSDAVGRNRGVRPVEQGEGDSIVAAFSRGVDAVAAAIEAQTRFDQEPWPDGAHVSVRMALHTGDAQLRDAFNYFGQTVIRAARLRALAHGGQVIASRATHDLVADHLPSGATWRDLGSHRLKDLGRPEVVYQLCHPDLRADFPPLRGLDASPNNLPAQLTSFIGRERELDEVATLLDEHRLVTLTGAGGCGKTRIALQLSANRVESHRDGVWYVDLASLAGTGTVARQVGDVLGVPDDDQRSLLTAMVEHIGNGAILLILDNCEHLVDDCASLVDGLLTGCPNLSVLATSRQVLEAPGEVVWRVPSMTVPATPVLPPIDALGALDAIRLFCERAARSRPGFALSMQNAETVTTICRRVDGIPLALELAAARVRTLGLEEILQGLDDRFRLLTGGARTLLPRQQTLAASVDWSYELLERGEQTLLRRLSVFAGAFTLPAALAVAGHDARDGVASLVDRSLVQLDDSSVPARYRYLETVKAYARARLARAEEEADARNRHLAYFLQATQQAESELVGPRQGEWLDRIDREHDDVRAALEWSAADLNFDSLLRLVIAMSPYWHARGHSREAQQWFSRALSEAPEAPAELRARVLWASAYQAAYSDDLELGWERAAEALALAQECGDDRTIARAMDTMATIEQFTDPTGTQPRFLEAAEYAARAGDLWCRTDSLQKAAYSDFYRDRWPEATALEQQAYALALETSNRFFLSWHWTLIGFHAWREGRCDDARIALRQAFEDGLAVGEPTTVAAGGTMLALVELLTGDIGAARDLVAETAAALGSNATEGLGGAVLGHLDAVLRLADGDAVTAAAIEAQVVDALLPHNVLFPTVTFMPALLAARIAAGQLEEAEQDLQRTRDIGQRLQNAMAGVFADVFEAVLERKRGRPDLADPKIRSALLALLASGFGPDAVDALEVLAGVLLDLGNATDAVRLLSSAATVRQENGWIGAYPTLIGTQASEDRDAATTAVGDRATALHDEGARLSLAEAATYAMRSHGTRRRPATGWASLTPTELEVVRLVAAGKTNPDIAADLFMSRATVKTHVSHILSKLRMTSRSELAAEAARHDP